jgi:hypothetical protein
MSAIDVLVSLCGIAVLAYVVVLVIKFLEDAKLLVINRHLAMVASALILLLCGAFARTYVFLQWLKAGVATTGINYWSFAAIACVYGLVFYLAITRRKTKPH